MSTELPLLTIVFIDYDNLLQHQKEAGVLDVVTNVLVRIPWDDSLTVGRCEIRLYGGWYEGNALSRLAQDVTVEVQRDFPAIIRVSREGGTALSLQTTAELAMALLQEPAYHLFNTYRRKQRPRNVRVEKPAAVGCCDADCILTHMKDLLKHGNCPKAGCTVSNGDLVYRHEQKIVDTMLACDLVHAVDRVAGRVILISGDDDFLPPLRAVLLRNGAVVRAHPQGNAQRMTLPYIGAKLLEVEL